jgi:non-heme chloroperoxidase
LARRYGSNVKRFIFLLAGLVSFTHSGLGDASTEISRLFDVKTPDGLNIKAQEQGNVRGAEIVFVHELNQSHLSWSRQIHSELATQFHLLTYDLRGHGFSDRPEDGIFYKEGKRWGDELNAVILAAGFHKPVLVGWSLGGLVILNYLKSYGEKNVAGLVFVDAVTKFDPALIGGESQKLSPFLLSSDLDKQIFGTRQFLGACFNRQPNREDFEMMLAFNSMVGPQVDAAIFQMKPTDLDAVLSQITAPALVVHGDLDRLCSPRTSDHTMSLVQTARLVQFHESGHSPFWEEPDKFNRTLSEFVQGFKP